MLKDNITETHLYKVAKHWQKGRIEANKLWVTSANGMVWSGTNTALQQVLVQVGPAHLVMCLSPPLNKSYILLHKTVFEYSQFRGLCQTNAYWEAWTQEINFPQSFFYYYYLLLCLTIMLALPGTWQLWWGCRLLMLVGNGQSNAISMSCSKSSFMLHRFI